MKEMIEKHFRDEYPTLVKRLKNRAGSVANAEDIVMEAFTRAYQYIDSFDPKRKEFGAWFNTILNNALRNFKKDERNYGMNMEFDEVKAGGNPMKTYRKSARNDMSKNIADVGNTLHKEILTMYFVTDYHPKDIQKVLDQPKSTVNSVIRRFTEKFKGRYEDTSS